MRLKEFVRCLEKGGRRWRMVGDDAAGVVAVLDLEGRLFTVCRGKILNRVNPGSFLEDSTAERYVNPGGNGLWPAPEGTCLGYEYSTGSWRVPPGLTAARYRVTDFRKTRMTIRAEVDLINSRGLGIPTVFERTVAVSREDEGLSVTGIERIRYVGSRKLLPGQFLLAPWSLEQFDCGPGCEVTLPDVDASCIWDFYTPSKDLRVREGGFWRIRTQGGRRYQVGIGPAAEWIEFVNPAANLRVRRAAQRIEPGLRYVDIGDRAPDARPIKAGTRYSVYNDSGDFMEAEAAGGCPPELNPGDVLSLTVRTRYGTCR